MSRQIVLLRGVNVGSRNRIAMPELRDALEAAGFADVQTYVQSGNVALTSPLSPEKLAAKCNRVIADSFGLDVDVLVRTQSQLAAIVRRNPLADVAEDPKRHQVTFLAEKLPAAEVKRLTELAANGEKLAVYGREVYAWHPAGVARSKLWARLAGRDLGVISTSRNWATVTKLLEL